MEQEKKTQLIQDFATAINKVSSENESNTPDFILANYLVMCLENFDHITNMRKDWYKPNIGDESLLALRTTFEANRM